MSDYVSKQEYIYSFHPQTLTLITNLNLSFGSGSEESDPDLLHISRQSELTKILSRQRMGDWPLSTSFECADSINVEVLLHSQPSASSEQMWN